MKLAVICNFICLLNDYLSNNFIYRFFADPSGTFMKYQAKAIGSGSEVAQNQLQDEYKKDIEFPAAEIMAVKILKQVMEEKLNANNVQIASVTKTSGFKIYSVEEVQNLINRL